MSNNGGFIPKGLSHFAMALVSKFRLPKASSLPEVERLIQAAIEEELRIRKEREPLACAACRILLLRYQTLREEFRDCCPECRRPMETPAAIDRRRVIELEAALRGALPGEARRGG